MGTVHDHPLATHSQSDPRSRTLDDLDPAGLQHGFEFSPPNVRWRGYREDALQYPAVLGSHNPTYSDAGTDSSTTVNQLEMIRQTGRAIPVTPGSVARRHSGPPLDPSCSSLSIAARPVRHPVVRNFTKGVWSTSWRKCALARSRSSRRNPVLFLFAQTLKHPFLEQPAVLRFLQQTQPVAHHFAGGSVAPHERPIVPQRRPVGGVARMFRVCRMAMVQRSGRVACCVNCCYSTGLQSERVIDRDVLVLQQHREEATFEF